jgi:NADPH:quinone reductase-like Zn-dependent oxidoreductase
MTETEPTAMRALCLREYGEPVDVLHIENIPVPKPGAGRVRVRVHACAVNPADLALCRGFFRMEPPRGIGLDVSGTADAVGEGVTGVRIGDQVFGVPDFRGYPSAGAAEYAILGVFVPVPRGLDLDHAAALPMAIETSVRALDLLGLKANQTILINGGGTMTGFAAVQVALERGARVITTAGGTFADRLRAFGAQVTPYGDGMVERARETAGGAPDFVFHTARVPGLLPDLIRIVDGDPRRVMSISDFDEQKLGVRTTGREPNVVLRYDALGHFAQLAADGRFSIPVARRYRLEEWREALERSFSGRAQGKLLLHP